jgi:hypothetical protein
MNNNPVDCTKTGGIVTIIQNEKPKISISPSTLNFGDVDVGISEQRTFTISNTGNKELTVSSIESGSAEFTVKPSSGSVGPGSSLLVTVTFTPFSSGVKNGTITVRGDDLTNAFIYVYVTGTVILSYIPYIRITSPNGDEEWRYGTFQNISWSFNRVNNVKIEYSIDNGSTWTMIVPSTSASAGSYSWMVPNVYSSQCLVKISDVSDGSIKDQSNSVFSIVPLAFLSVISPKGGESWTAGSNQSITWITMHVTNVKIEYSTNGGVSWVIINASISASMGSYSWTVPNVSSSQCLVRVSDALNPSVAVQSY